METKKRLGGWLALLWAALLTVGFVACSSSEDSVIGPDGPTAQVNSPTKVVPYEKTTTFQNDLDALATYALDQRALRWAYLLMASNGNIESAPFSASVEDIDGKVGQMVSEYMYGILEHMSENAEAYEEAFNRLADYGVLDKENGQKTRGYKSDIIEFGLGVKKAEKMGRQSVMAILRSGGWATNTGKLTELYNTLPSSLTCGYSNASDFWADFSAGKIDSRSNQVFINLYTYDPMDFGAKADDLGVTPARNMAVAGADLINKGLNVVLDACPLATQLSYGKDLYGAVDATANLIQNGDVKGFMQNMTGNLINYGRNWSKIVDKMKNNEMIYWEAADDFWDNYGQDIATVLNNDVVFGSDFKESLDHGSGEHLIPNIIKTRDANGKEISLVIILDEKTGQLTGGYVFDENGNIIADPKLPGIKKITVVDRNGRRKTKTVVVPPDEPTELVVDLDEGEQVLEDEPADGYIYLQPGSIYDEYGQSGTEEVRVRTNYLYYKAYADSESKWLSAKEYSDMSQVSITYAANDTGEKRQGKVYVVGTNKDGKVLKQEVITVTQDPKPTGDLIWTTPTSVTFDGAGGKQNIVVNHDPNYSFIGVLEGNDLSGWCYLESVDSDPGSPTYVINCEPNNTGEERSGVATFFTANSRSALENVLYNGAKPDGTTVASTTVLIKQEATVVSGDIKIVEIEVEPHLAYRFNNGSVEYEDIFNVWEHQMKVYNVSVSKLSGDKAYVEGTYSDANNGLQQETTVTFYLENVSQDYSKWKIVSLNIDNFLNYKGSDSWSEEKQIFTATNIPCTSIGNFGSFLFTGKAADGVSGISGRSTAKGNNGYENYTNTFESVEWEGNYIEVHIKFEE